MLQKSLLPLIPQQECPHANTLLQATFFFSEHSCPKFNKKKLRKNIHTAELQMSSSAFGAFFVEFLSVSWVPQYRQCFALLYTSNCKWT